MSDGGLLVLKMLIRGALSELSEEDRKVIYDTADGIKKQCSQSDGVKIALVLAAIDTIEEW
jgi:hypothetical protein